MQRRIAMGVGAVLTIAGLLLALPALADTGQPNGVVAEQQSYMSLDHHNTMDTSEMAALHDAMNGQSHMKGHMNGQGHMKGHMNGQGHMMGQGHMNETSRMNGIVTAVG